MKSEKASGKLGLVHFLELFLWRTQRELLGSDSFRPDTAAEIRCFCSTWTPASALITRRCWIILSFQVDIFFGVFYMLHRFIILRYLYSFRGGFVLFFASVRNIINLTTSYEGVGMKSSEKHPEQLTQTFAFLHTAPPDYFRKMSVVQCRSESTWKYLSISECGRTKVEFSLILTCAFI